MAFDGQSNQVSAFPGFLQIKHPSCDLAPSTAPRRTAFSIAAVSRAPDGDAASARRRATRKEMLDMPRPRLEVDDSGRPADVTALARLGGVEDGRPVADRSVRDPALRDRAGEPADATAGPRLLGVAGSARPGSPSAHALGIALAAARAAGANVALLEPARLDLPPGGGDPRGHWPDRPHVGVLRRAFLDADGILLATPEYRGGLSGTLKNALNLLDVRHGDGKVFAGIVATGGRPDGSALEAMAALVRSLRGWMLSEHVSIPYAQSAFDGERCYDEELPDRLKALALDLVRVAIMLRRATFPASGRPATVAGGSAPFAGGRRRGTGPRRIPDVPIAPAGRT
jgi:FMN reductase